MSADHTPEFLAQYPAFYGRAYAKVWPQYDQCAGRVSGDRWALGSSQCSRANGHGPHGAWCKQHNPEAVSARREASNAKYRAESDAANRDREFTRAARAAVNLIAAGHNDPRALCADILRDWGPKE